MTSGNSITSGCMSSTSRAASQKPATKPSGMASAISTASSPKSSTETSRRVKPSTRRLASSQARSASWMRALLYTTPTAMVAAKMLSTMVKNITLRAVVSWKVSTRLRLTITTAAAVVIVNRTLIDTFRETSARNVLFFTTVLSLFAATIAVGVVYNNARIQLAERAWELASLRVLGFTRREVSVLLLGELAVEIALAIPLGFVAGFWLAALLVALMQQEVMEFPLVIFPSTYLYAGAVVLAAGVLSALIVRNRIDNLDLVAVLKTRE